MTTDRYAAAREAEKALWRQYDLTVDERFVATGGGRRVRVLECGAPGGKPLIFVQGGLGDAFVWAPLIALLKDFRCITLDRPGSGFSDGVDFMNVDVRDLAVDTLSAALDSAGLAAAAFVANSMGGWWTFQLAMKTPARVSRMAMLGCPALLLDTSAPFPMRLMSLPVLGKSMVKLMSPPSPAKARTLPSVLGHPAEVGKRWSETEAEAFYCFGNLPNVQPSWRTLLRRFLRLTGANPQLRVTEAELRRTDQPTLFAWGKGDPFGSVKSGRHAASLMPNARLEVVGTGHLPWWDELEPCARLVRQFASAS